MKVDKIRNLQSLLRNIVLGGAMSLLILNYDRNNLELCKHRVHKKHLPKGETGCKLEFSKFCIMGEQKTVSSGTLFSISKDLLDYVHTDVWELSPT